MVYSNGLVRKTELWGSWVEHRLCEVNYCLEVYIYQSLHYIMI